MRKIQIADINGGKGRRSNTSPTLPHDVCIMGPEAALYKKGRTDSQKGTQQQFYWIPPAILRRATLKRRRVNSCRNKSEREELFKKPQPRTEAPEKKVITISVSLSGCLVEFPS